MCAADSSQPRELETNVGSTKLRIYIPCEFNSLWLLYQEKNVLVDSKHLACEMSDFKPADGGAEEKANGSCSTADVTGGRTPLNLVLLLTCEKHIHVAVRQAKNIIFNV